MKRTEACLFVLAFLSISAFAPSAMPITHASSPRISDEANSPIKSKFELLLWEETQALKSNGTMKDLSLIIWLKSDKRVTGIQIEDLKSYAASLFTSCHNATVLSVLRVLPIVMAKVPVDEVEKIASYDFVESISNGQRRGFVTCDISRSAIKADQVETVLGRNGSGIIIAILDTGVNSSHPDLNDLDDKTATPYDYKVLIEKSFIDLDDDNILDEGYEDSIGHGTHIAGIVAGTGESSSYQYVGVAPGAWIMNIKVCSGTYPMAFQRNDVINGIEYVLDHPTLRADVICFAAGEKDPDGDGTSDLAKAFDYAVEKGVVVVTAAGNKELDIQTITTPGDAFNVITVGAIDDKNTTNISDDELWENSNRGPAGGRPKPDVVAPGVNITAPMSSDTLYWQECPWIRVEEGYAQLSGTSMAAAHVAGTVALMLEANPNLTPAQTKAILKQTARLNDNLNDLGLNDRGRGIIDAYEAVQLAENVENIAFGTIFDGWFVRTPNREWNWGLNGDYLTFYVSTPFALWGVNVAAVNYHCWWWNGQLDYKILSELNARHVWIDDTYYDLGTDMDRYLFSGPRIYEKGAGYVMMRALYKVGDVFVEYLFKIGVDEMWLKLNFKGGSDWRTLIYINPDVWDSKNYAHRPSTGRDMLYERKICGDALVDIRDPDHDEYIQIDPESTDNPVMWILKYPYFGNNPGSAETDEYIFNEDIVVYYQASSYYPDPGPCIYRKDNPIVIPDNTQDDAGTGNDAGNNFTQATSINAGSYTGILCYSDPEDTNDWYKFDVENATSISVSLTPPSGIDFDLELYDPAGNLKAGSYLGPGQKDEVSYITDSSGYWRARMYIQSGEAQYHFFVASHSGGGGGCPILYVYNGTEYVSEGLLDIHNPDGTDIVANHTLITTPKRVRTKYLVRLTEHPQTISHIDQVRLFAILQDKTTIPLPLVSAIHSEHGSVLLQLLFSDDLKTDTLGANWNNGTSQSIELKFLALPPNIRALGFVFQIEGNNPLIK